MAINTLESNGLFLSQETFGNSQFGTKMGYFRDSFGFLSVNFPDSENATKPCMGQQYPNHIQIWGFYVSVITLSWGIYVPFISLTRVFCLSKFPEMGFYAPAFTLTWVFYILVFTLTWDIYFPVIKLTRGFYDPIITRTWGFYVLEITLTWLFCVSK